MRGRPPIYTLEEARERRLITHREWRNNNRERYREAARRNWRSTGAQRRKRAKDNGTFRKYRGCGLRQADIELLYARQRGRCAYCKKKLPSLLEKPRRFHVDHIPPRVLGGVNGLGNSQLLCSPCNLSKGGQHPLEFARKIGLLI